MCGPGPHRGFRQCQELPVIRHRDTESSPKLEKAPDEKSNMQHVVGTSGRRLQVPAQLKNSYSFIVNLQPEIPIPTSGATLKPSQMSDVEGCNEWIGQCFAAHGGTWAILEVQIWTNQFKGQFAAPLWTLILVFYPRGAGYTRPQIIPPSELPEQFYEAATLVKMLNEHFPSPFGWWRIQPWAENSFGSTVAFINTKSKRRVLNINII